ncbi:TPA: hypothetical protein I9Y37_001927 [Citrobacter freundii]|nr:hypothetical protein [Citrobacter freundii]HAT3963902.1 hypothetical protein [Citrobacter freundii]
MKPMLKTAFFSAVKSLLKNGVKPYFRAANFGKLGLIEFVGTNGNNHVEQVYSCAWYSAERMSARFQGWFRAAVAEFNAEIAESLDLNDKVMHGDTVRTVTGFRNDVIRSSNGTPRKYKRTGVLILDYSIEVMASDVTPIEKQSTSSDSAATEPEDILPMGDEAGEIVLEVETMISVKQRYPMEFAVVGHHVFVGAIRTDFEYDKNFYFGVNLKETVIGREVFLRVPELEPSFFTENASAFKMQAQREIIILPDRDFSPIGGTKALQRDILGSASRCHTAATPTIMGVDHE